MASSPFLDLSAYQCTLGDKPHFYRDPRLLRCLHSFCKDCLQDLSSTFPPRDTITCPTCGKARKGGDKWMHVNSLSPNLRLAEETKGAAILSKLQSSSPPSCEKCISELPAVIFCTTCGQFLCSDCEIVHQKWRELMDHKRVAFTEMYGVGITNLFPPPTPRLCPSHPEEILCLYCPNKCCKKFTCRKCSHRSWSGNCRKLEIDEAAAESRKEVSRILTSFNGPAAAIKRLEDTIKESQAMEASLKERIDQAKTTINKSFDTAAAPSSGDDEAVELKKRREALLAEVDATAASKLTRLYIEREKMEKMRDQLSSCLQVVKGSQDNFTDVQFLTAVDSFKDYITDQMNDYLLLLPLQLGETDFLEVEVDPANQVGQVSGGCSLETSVIVTQQASRAIHKIDRTLVLEARDESGRPFGRGGEEVRVMLKWAGGYSNKEFQLSENMSQKMTKYGVVDEKNGCYNISFKCYRRGPHELHVSIRQQPIQGSPFPVYARRWRSYSNDRTCIWPDDNIKDQYSESMSAGLPGKPGSIAPGDRCLYITEYHGQHLYQVYPGWHWDSGNGLAEPITVDGAKQLQAIATLDHNVIFVTDRQNNEVMKLTRSAGVLARFGERGSGKGQFNNPTGLAVDSEGRIYVGDCGNKRVQIFNSDFSHHLTIPLPDQVQGIALDTSCNIHITQSGHIKVYSPSGQYIRQYGRGKLRQPQDVYVDEDGYCLVTDSGTNPVKVFYSCGDLVVSFGKDVKHAHGICITPYGLHGTFIYVCDRDDDCFVMY